MMISTITDVKKKTKFKDIENQLISENKFKDTSYLHDLITRAESVNNKQLVRELIKQPALHININRRILLAIKHEELYTLKRIIQNQDRYIYKSYQEVILLDIYYDLKQTDFFKTLGSKKKEKYRKQVLEELIIRNPKLSKKEKLRYTLQFKYLEGVKHMVNQMPLIPVDILHNVIEGGDLNILKEILTVPKLISFGNHVERIVSQMIDVQRYDMLLELLKRDDFNLDLSSLYAFRDDDSYFSDEEEDEVIMFSTTHICKGLCNKAKNIEDAHVLHKVLVSNQFNLKDHDIGLLEDKINKIFKL